MPFEEGVALRTRWLVRELVPYDEIVALDGGAVTLASGQRRAVSVAQAIGVAQALAVPAATGDPGADATAFAAYLQGPWSPVRAARVLLAMASAAGASDVHLAAEAGGFACQLRRVGALGPFLTLPPARGARLIAALKHLAGCMPYRSDLVQEGRIPREGITADARAAFLPTALGERAAVRLFGRLLALQELGLDPAVLARFEALLAAPTGLVLVAGPSGAGKTTTLYATLAHLAARRSEAHLSIEDPVEQRLRMAGIPVDQVELCPERGLTGEAALVGALRQDVDVLAVGELRTAREAALALEAAHTGRLVLAGLHAGSGTEATRRLLDLGVQPRVLQTSLLGVLHQRLEVRPCPACLGTGCPACGGLGRHRVAVATLTEPPAG
ncbi:MAG: ATPase, T2SS/T4P/T4SS family [Pseudomonadota bacterium]